MINIIGNVFCKGLLRTLRLFPKQNFSLKRGCERGQWLCVLVANPLISNAPPNVKAGGDANQDSRREFRM